MSPDPAPGSLPRRAILVLGMHRSGTSALTGALEQMGCATPATQIGKGEQNPRGFFESRLVSALNDRILALHGTSWEDWRNLPPLPDGAEAEYVSLRNEASALIDSEFGEAELIAFKDPRLCKLLPVWRDLFVAKGYALHVAIPLRHPQEVAASLARRNGFAPEQGLILWLSHVLGAEYLSRGMVRCFTLYTQLLTNPVAQMKTLEARLGLTFPRRAAGAGAGLRGFLSDSLRHHHGDTDSPALPGPLREAHEVLTRWADSGEDPADYAALDAVRTRLTTLGAMAGSDLPPQAAFELLFQLQGEISPDLQQRLEDIPQENTPDALLPLLTEVNTILRLRLQDVETQLDGLPEELAARHAELGAMARLLAGRDSAHGEAEARLAEALRALSDSRETRRKLVEDNHALTREQARQETLISELHALVAKVEGKRAALEQECISLRDTARENAELHALVARVEAERAAIANSTIWRMTAPLRRLMAPLRRRR